jgi:hypothetical protein
MFACCLIILRDYVLYNVLFFKIFSFRYEELRRTFMRSRSERIGFLNYRQTNLFVKELHIFQAEAEQFSFSRN